MLFASVASTSIDSGLLSQEVSSIVVQFNQAVIGGNVAANYELRRAGSDGLLLAADAPVNPTTVSMSGNSATLQFASLTEDVYRLTVRSSITDSGGSPLDGDNDGLVGGDWRRDFVVGLLSSPGVTMLPPSTSATSELFGVTIAVSGNKVIVGASSSDTGAVDSGVVYIRDATTGAALLTIVNPDPDASDYFGSSVAIDGDIAVVGAFGDDSDGFADSGRVYVFNAVTGSLIRTITNPTPAINDNFGVSVAISGTTVVASAYNDDTSGTDSGRVYLFNANSGAAIGSPLVSPSPAGGDQFGGSVAIDDGYVIVGAWKDDVGSTADSGRAFLYNAANGQFIRAFANPTEAASDFYGVSVAISGNRVVVGAYGDDTTGTDSGIAYVWNADTGTLLHTLANPIPSGDAFGWNVAISGEGIVVGAYLDDTSGTNSGRAYLFDTTTGLLLSHLANPTPSVSDFFGYGVAVSSKAAFVGAYNDDTQNTNQGAAYSFRINRQSWTDPTGLSFNVDGLSLNAGQLIQGSSNAFDGLNRLQVGGSNYAPSVSLESILADSERTLVTPSSTISGLAVQREITVPIAGSEGFVRSIEVLTNPSSTAVTTPIPVRFVGNLGSDGATTVFATSDGDTIVETTDWWIGTDDDIATGGTPALIHILRSPQGLAPSSVLVTEDNIEWTHDLTFTGNETKRLGSFTIQATTRQQAIDDTIALITPSTFREQAAVYLTPNERATLANFDFQTTVASTTIDSGMLSQGVNSITINFSEPVYNAGAVGGASIISWWTGNNVTTDSVGANSGTLVNGATYTNSGKIGAAFALDGVNDYVQLGSPANLVVTNQLTLEGWIQQTGAIPSNVQTIAGKEGEYVLGILASGNLFYGLANTTPGWVTRNTGFSIPRDGIWRHVAMTYDGTKARIYVNGSEVYAATESGVIGDNSPAENEFRIGGRQSNNIDYFKGNIDEVGVFNRALSANEIYSLYLGENVGNARNQPQSFSLKRAGADGLLGTIDDVGINLASNYSNISSFSSSTLSFSSFLPDDVYRLTIVDSIRDHAGNALDGDLDGNVGGSWHRDFVVGALKKTLISPNGFSFDVNISGLGAGQLVQGTDNAFDGLNRLEVNSVDYAPTPLVKTTEVQGSGTFFSSTSMSNVPNLESTLTLTESKTLRLSAALTVATTNSNSGYLAAQFSVNGVPASTGHLAIAHLSQSSYAANADTVNLEDFITLAPGTYTIRVQALTGGSNLQFMGSSPWLRIMEFAPLAASTTEVQSTVSSFSSSTMTNVTGLTTTLNLVETQTVRLSSTIVASPQTSGANYLAAQFTINGVATSTSQTSQSNLSPSSFGASVDTICIEDFVTLGPGTHVIQVQAMTNGNSVTLNTGSSPWLRVTKFAPLVATSTEVQGSVTSFSSTNLANVPGLEVTLNLAETKSVLLSSQLTVTPQNGSFNYLGAQFTVNGSSTTNYLGLTYLSSSTNGASVDTVSIEDIVTLGPGTYTIRVQAFSSGNVVQFIGSSPWLRVTEFANALTSDTGRTILTQPQSLAGISVSREVMVPSTGSIDFSRTVDVLTNPNASPVTTPVPVRIVGNLGSEAATTVFATSDGDLVVETTDWWFGTDDDNATGGTPAIVHLLHGPFGLTPSIVSVIDDNVEWTYNFTFAPNETKRLATFTVLGNTRQEAIDAANALVTASGFGGEAAAFLTASELGSLANFKFGKLSVNLDGTGELTINDVDVIGKDNNFTVSLSGSNLQITDAVESFNSVPVGASLSNSDRTLTIPLSMVTGAINFNTAAGNDTLTIDFSEGNLIPTGGIAFNGGAGGDDELKILGGNQGTVSYNYTNAHDGSVALSNYGTISYTGLEPILNSGTATDVVFNLPAGQNVVTLGDDGISGNGLSRLSGATFELTDFANPTGHVTINAGNAADTLTVASLPDYTSGLQLGTVAHPLSQVQLTGTLSLASSKYLLANATNGVTVASTAALTLSSGGQYVIEADVDADAVGDYVHDAGGTVTVGIDWLVEAADINLNGTITATFGNGRFSPSTAATSIGVGAAGTFNISDAEIDRTSFGNGGSLSIGSNTHTGDFHVAGTEAITSGNLAFSTGGSIAVGDFNVTSSNYLALVTDQDSNGTGAITTGVGVLGASQLYTRSAQGTTLNTNTNWFNAVNTTSGDITVNEANSIQLVFSGVQTQGGNGNISVTASSIFVDPGNSGVSAHGSGSVNLTATSGNINVGKWIMSASGPIVLSGTNGIMLSTANSDITTSGTLSINADADNNGMGTFASNHSGAVINAASVSIAAADLTLLGPIDSGTGTVNITPTNSRPIDLGNDTVGSIGLTDAELDGITAGLLRIGDGDAGTITVSAAIETANTNRMHLTTGASVVVNSGVGITENELAITAGGKIGFDYLTYSDVDILAATTTSGNIQFRDSDDLTIGMVDGVSGITTLSGIIEAYSAGNITVSQPMDTDNGFFSLNARADEALITVNATINATYSSAIVADKVAINAPIAVSGASGQLFIRAEGDGDVHDALNVGSIGDSADDTLEISDAELDLLNVFVIQLGYHYDDITGDVTISDAIAPAFATQLVITSGGNGRILTFQSGASISIPGGYVNLVAEGNGSGIITDGTGIDVTAATANFRAGTLGIGSAANPLRMSLTSQIETTTDNSDQYLHEADGVQVGSVGMSAYGGSVHLMNGSFQLTTFNSIESNTVVHSGATLSGIGTVDGTVSIASSGTLAPGFSPGIFNTGNVTFDSGAIFTIEVNGNSPGTQHDQLNVTGTVSLNGATLAVIGTITSVPGQQVVLIENDASDAVMGTFAGLPQGAIVTINSVNFRILYDGGTDSNDVVLVQDLASATISITSEDAVYNRATYVPSALITGNSLPLPDLYFQFYTDALGNDVIAAPMDVGSYYVRAFLVANATNNAAQSAIVPFQITPFALTATATAASKVYDATTDVAVSVELFGVFPGDLVMGSALGILDNKNVGNNKPVTIGAITLDGANAVNYTVGAAPNTTADVASRMLAGSITVASKVFDSTTSATILTRSLAGVMGSDVVSYIGGTAIFDTSTVGKAKMVTALGLQLSGTDAGNYIVNATATTTADIKYAAFIFYNGATTVGGAGATGFGASNTPGASFAATGGNPPVLAIDTKAPLLPGASSSFNNYTNVSFGLNGILVDLASTTGTITASDFSFAIGETTSMAGFTTLVGTALLAVNPQVTQYTGGGIGGSTRAKITFNNNSLKNTWLKVTVLANSNTALASDEVFYFGNVVGDVNGSVTSGRYSVNAIDTGAVRSNQSSTANSVLITNVYDFNKSGNVNAIDTSIVRTNQQSSGFVKVINSASMSFVSDEDSDSSLNAPTASLRESVTDSLMTDLGWLSSLLESDSTKRRK